MLIKCRFLLKTNKQKLSAFLPPASLFPTGMLRNLYGKIFFFPVREEE